MTPAERAELERRLREAENAYHDILTGKSVQTVVDQNGERVTYNAASVTRLASYIQELKRQLGKLGRTEQPMGFVL